MRCNVDKIKDKSDTGSVKTNAYFRTLPVHRTMARKFVTIFPVTENVHLIKDVGQIPYNLHAEFGYESTVVCYPNSTKYPNLDGEVKGLNLEFLKDQGRKLFMEKAVLNYLKSYAKSIDVLNLYHLTKETVQYGLLYKKLHPKGILYIKMDVYNEMLEQGITYSKKGWKNAIHKQFEKRFMRKVDLMSCENEYSLALLKKTFPSAASKFFWVPNGVNEAFVDAHFPTTKTWVEKENIILSVGRIGSVEKNNEMLLEALGHVDLENWKVILAGPVEPRFKSAMESAVEKFPNLRGRVEFTGEITDRKALFDLYDRAKIFCLTSPFESFGIAFVEGLFFGNYLVGNDGHSSFDSFVKNGQFGQKVDKTDVTELAHLLSILVSNEPHPEGCEAAKAFAREHFSYSKIVKSIHENIENIVTK